ncbi:hypothetical protein SLEP1_g1178 [Rubroshorea leprosula]|uniref:Uncharacterized protein n=1 Tax=Rubroshorea leprosula TaxID=152421 RepID=A0AAV5HIS2_9ROSI|nr:hypothetical protein SLEP1_g1178 [Rubroshorea leprosula]
MAPNGGFDIKKMIEYCLLFRLETCYEFLLGGLEMGVHY